jgi:sterol desaturase/sphingolipid hydroxylase (fatty acid hydroxylase superfamily)
LTGFTKPSKRTKKIIKFCFCKLYEAGKRHFSNRSVRRALRIGKKATAQKQIESPETGIVRNLAIASAAGIAMNFLEKPVAEKLMRFVERKRFGLLKIFNLPKFLETILALILLDYTLYLWHVLTHKSKFLWRFHQVHHADLDLTVSTAVRFHFGEISISVLFRAAQILLIGVSPGAFKIWQIALFASVFFHHSNVRLPFEFERKLEKFMRRRGFTEFIIRKRKVREIQIGRAG